MDLDLAEVVLREVRAILNGEVFAGVLGTPCKSWGLLFQNFGPGTRTASNPEGDGTQESENLGNR